MRKQDRISDHWEIDLTRWRVVDMGRWYTITLSATETRHGNLMYPGSADDSEHFQDVIKKIEAAQINMNVQRNNRENESTSLTQ